MSSLVWLLSQLNEKKYYKGSSICSCSVLYEDTSKALSVKIIL